MIGASVKQDRRLTLCGTQAIGMAGEFGSMPYDQINGKTSLINALRCLTDRKLSTESLGLLALVSNAGRHGHDLRMVTQPKIDFTNRGLARRTADRRAFKPKVNVMENLPPSHFTSIAAPVIENAPGLSWESRKVGSAAIWDARPDLIRRGFEPARVVLWIGTDLTEHGRTFIRSRCVALQADMDRWESARQFKPIPFDYMLHSLIDNYLVDGISEHHKNRYPTRGTTANLCRRLLQDRGSTVIADIKFRTLREWHKEWTESGIAMAHALMAQLGTLLVFGMTILECDHCAKVAQIKRSMRFENVKPRKVWMTFEQIKSICEKAHELDLPSIALAQALAWASSMREKDCIGEYVPTSEPGDGITFGNKKWLRGALYQEIDNAFIWHHIQSKRGHLIEAPLYEEPLLVDELNKRFPGCIVRAGETIIPHRERLPATGPVIISEATGLPYTGAAFRRTWRRVADAAGIPGHVQFRDTRSSAITEATNAGVSLEIVAKAAGHSNTSQTAAYSRDQSEKHAISMRARALSRVTQGNAA